MPRDPNAATKSESPKLYEAASSQQRFLIAARSEQEARQIFREQDGIPTSVRIHLKPHTKALRMTSDGDTYYKMRAADVAKRFCPGVVPQE